MRDNKPAEVSEVQANFGDAGSFGTHDVFYYEPLVPRVEGKVGRIGYRMHGCFCRDCVTANKDRQDPSVANCSGDKEWAEGWLVRVDTFAGECRACTKKRNDGRTIPTLPPGRGEPREYLLKCKLCGGDDTSNNNVHTYCCKRGITKVAKDYVWFCQDCASIIQKGKSKDDNVQNHSVPRNLNMGVKGWLVKFDTPANYKDKAVDDLLPEVEQNQPEAVGPREPPTPQQTPPLSSPTKKRAADTTEMQPPEGRATQQRRMGDDDGANDNDDNAKDEGDVVYNLMSTKEVDELREKRLKLLQEQKKKFAQRRTPYQVDKVRLDETYLCSCTVCTFHSDNTNCRGDDVERCEDCKSCYVLKQHSNKWLCGSCTSNDDDDESEEE